MTEEEAILLKKISNKLPHTYRMKVDDGTNYIIYFLDHLEGHLLDHYIEFIQTVIIFCHDRLKACEKTSSEMCKETKDLRGYSFIDLNLIEIFYSFDDALKFLISKRLITRSDAIMYRLSV